MNTLQVKNTTGSNLYGRSSFIGAMTAVCLFAGICGSIMDIFTLQSHFLPFPMLVGCGIILANWLMRKFGRIGKMLFILFLMGGVAFCALQESVISGFIWCINRISTVIGTHIARNLPQYAAGGTSAPYTCTILAGIVALICLWLVQIQSRMIPLLFAASIVALDLALGVSCSSLWILLLTASVLMLNFPNMLFLRDSRAGFLTVLLMGLAATGIFLSVRLYLVNQELPQVEQLHDTLHNQIETTMYGNSTDLPEGDFSGIGALNRTNEPMLDVTMGTPESLYLRGFVGSEYTSSGWKEAENSALANHADLFYWLHQTGFYGQTQLAQAAMLLDDSLSTSDYTSMTITPIGANRKYIYAPYELVDSDMLSASEIGDIRIRRSSFSSPESYNFTVLPNQVKRYGALVAMLESTEDSDIINDYVIAESHYNAYVYDQFLSVPDDIRRLLNKLMGPADFSNMAHLDYGSAKQRILVWLDENISYRENHASHLDDTDFLEEFLTITQSGYDVHYATASVMMMRYFGIPARYVEGYLITPEDASAMKSGMPYTLDETRAHAWTEIYQDGIGWIPFETTPKYTNLMEQSDMLRGTGAAPTDPITDPETPPVQENSLDMEEDFHEDPEEDDEDEDTQPFPWIGYALLAFLLILILLIFCLLIGRWIAMMRLNHSFKLSDRKKAVINLYAYLFALMREIYQWSDCVAPSGFIETVRSDLGEDSAIKYREIIRICEESAFSGDGVKEEDYRMVFAFTCKTRQLLAKRVRHLRKFRLRYLEHMI